MERGSKGKKAEKALAARILAEGQASAANLDEVTGQEKQDAEAVLTAQQAILQNRE